MVNIFSRIFRFSILAPLVAGLALSGTSCVTTYDAYGRPVQTVDPGAAIVGVAAAGILGAAIASNHNHHHGYHGPRGPHRGGYYGGYYGY